MSSAATREEDAPNAATLERLHTSFTHGFGPFLELLPGLNLDGLRSTGRAAGDAWGHYQRVL